MKDQWTCRSCGGPVRKTRGGQAFRHREWRIGKEGIHQGDRYCAGGPVLPPDDRDRLRDLVVERFGPVWARSDPTKNWTEK